MTAPDPAWVEAGAKALTAGKTYGGWIHDEDAWRAATGIAEKIIAAVEPLITAQTLEFCCEDTEPDIRKQIADEVEMRCHQIHHGAGDCPHCGPIIRMIRIKEE